MILSIVHVAPMAFSRETAYANRLLAFFSFESSVARFQQDVLAYPRLLILRTILVPTSGPMIGAGMHDAARALGRPTQRQ